MWIWWVTLYLLLLFVFLAGWAAMHEAQRRDRETWEALDEEERAHQAWLALRERERRRPLRSPWDEDEAA